MCVTLEQQLDLEREMMDGGIERYRNHLNKSLEKGKESRTLHGRTIISQAIGAVSEGIETIKQGKSNRDIAAKRLRDMDSQAVAFIALTSLVDTLSRDTTLLTVGKRVGIAVEMQDRLQKWIDIEGKPAINVIEKANEKGETARAVGLVHKMNKDGYGYLAWSREERMHVGLRLIDAIIVNTGIISLKTVNSGKQKTTTYVNATDKTTEWIKAFNDVAETWKPKYMPTIIEPKDWTDITGGGYYGGFVEPLPIVRRR